MDVKGKTRRLPIKADIRKALCFPGGSTLLVSHLKLDVSADSAGSLKLGFSLQHNGELCSAIVENPAFGFSIEGCNTVNTLNQITNRTETSQPEMLVNDGLAKDDKKLDGKLNSPFTLKILNTIVIWTLHSNVISFDALHELDVLPSPCT